MRSSDQVFRMVEDEFLSTAKLYTRHLHREAYVEAKRRAKARGGAMLRDLGRATDGRTERGVRGGLEDEARERRKREKSEEVEEQLEEWLDPQLAGLMKGREEARVVCRTSKGVGRKIVGVKGDTRAARGFGRSPAKVKKRDVEAMWHGEDEIGASSKRKRVGVEEDDSDDLDATRPRAAPSKFAARAAASKQSTTAARPEPPTDIFKPYTQSSKPTAVTITSSKTPRSNLPTPPTDQPSSPNTKPVKSKLSDPFSDDTHGLLTNRAERDGVAEFLARKKAAREKKALGKGDGGSGSAKKFKREQGGKGEEQEYDDVPTFMI
ncbi:hypothetical protein B0A48_04752 [Cryoendolithus antarcticus]|uniref:Uncharacterized protein n=1 Tax=Cryoendolithus antarcticus TaxID=1507870 RepID=A0A1V8TDK9_9PEZI|nr:hypothetical protein B0A48_04752 [Cryoendolithus antarcticus]